MTRRTRRQTLAATGTALAGALAGCGGLNPLSSASRVEYDASALDALPGDIPRISAAAPVEPSRAHVAAARERVHSLLDDLDPSRVPNDVVRRRLVRERDAAREALDADEAESRVDALSGLAYPRSEAMFAHAGLAAFDGELDDSAVAARRGRHHREAAAFLADYRYVGPPDDPVGALAEHARIVDWAHTGVRLTANAGDHSEYENAVLSVADLASDVEWGRAYAADARRLRERYAATLDESADYGGRFARVAADLGEAVAAHADAPDWEGLTSGFERDVEGTAGAKLLEELARGRWAGARNAADARADGRDALAVLPAMRSLAADRALDAARDAVADGAYAIPESVEPIAAEREAAVGGLRALLDAPSAPLARRLAAHVRSPIRSADERLRRGYDDDAGTSLYAQYAAANRFAAAAPAVVRRVGDALDA